MKKRLKWIGFLNSAFRIESETGLGGGFCQALIVSVWQVGQLRRLLAKEAQAFSVPVSNLVLRYLGRPP